MATRLGTLLIVMTASMTLAAGVAEACCGYGCCDCSCVANVAANDADALAAKIRALIKESGYECTSLELVAKTDKGTIVIQQRTDGTVHQPPTQRK